MARATVGIVVCELVKPHSEGISQRKGKVYKPVNTMYSLHAFVVDPNKRTTISLTWTVPRSRHPYSNSLRPLKLIQNGPLGIPGPWDYRKVSFQINHICSFCPPESALRPKKIEGKVKLNLGFQGHKSCKNHELRHKEKIYLHLASIHASIRGNWRPPRKLTLQR
jgi:hypothetical protein